MIKNLARTFFIPVFFLLVFFEGENLYADSNTEVNPCLRDLSNLGLEQIEKLDCGLAKKIVNDPQIKEEHENKILDKLASQLALQAEQSIEELALLDQFYSEKGKSLLLSKDVEKKCQLQVIANPKCESKTNQENYNKKLNMLMSKLSNMSGNNLMDKFFDKYSSMREPDANKYGSCPLGQTTGSFILDSQLTDFDAKNLIEILQGCRSSECRSGDGQDFSKSYFDHFAQFKLIRSAEEQLGNSGKEFKNEFEDFVKRYSPQNGSPSDYVSSFFFADKNQSLLASTVANQCGQIASNVEKFLCDDLSHLGMPEELSDNKFFKGSKFELERAVSKGFRCLPEKTSAAEDAEIYVGNTPSNWYEDFISNTRKDTGKIAINRKVQQFCSLYTCQDAKSRDLASCKNGGPVTSADLYKSYCREDQKGVKSKCSDEIIEKAIAYLQSFEKIKTDSSEVSSSSLASSESQNTPEVTKKSSRSLFFENFVKIENPLDVNASKLIVSNENSQNKIETKEGSAIPLSVGGQKSPTIGDQQATPNQLGKIEMGNQQAAQGPMNQKQNYDSFVISQGQQIENENMRKALVNKLINSSDQSKKQDPQSVANHQSIDELKKLRTELADVIDSVKGNEEEKLATVATNNQLIMAPKQKGSLDEKSSLNNSEKERLEQYREGLKSWESRLRNWEGELGERERRDFLGNSSGSSNGASSGNSMASAKSEGRKESVGNQAMDSQSSSTGDSGVLRQARNPAGTAGPVEKASGEVAGKGASESALDVNSPIVSSDKLAVLKKEALKNYGINTEDSFIIRVRHLDKIYAIPVKTFTADGKKMLVPLLNDKNAELAKIVYNSPLFSDYRLYQSTKL